MSQIIGRLIAIMILTGVLALITLASAELVHLLT